MGFASSIKAAFHRNGLFPRRWLTGLVSYSRYLGYIKPQLLQSTEEEFRIRRQMVARAWEPRRLTAPLGKCILALCPHPDDESIGTGGLLLAHRDLAEIHLVCLCDGARGGSLGGPDSTPELLVKTRRPNSTKPRQHCGRPQFSTWIIPTATSPAPPRRRRH
jgi:hypothetical protein